ncbi:zinc finger protein [Theobroma cacao]|nr:zinc finger protein [Theobroma cacao]
MASVEELCSICFEDASDISDRTVVRLRCSHVFHLDCIGSAFNSNGVMQCPNCRHLENGTWRRFPHINMEETTNEEWAEDDHEEFRWYNPSAWQSSSCFGCDVIIMCVCPQYERPTSHLEEWATRILLVHLDLSTNNQRVGRSQVASSNDIRRHSALRRRAVEFSVNQATTGFASSRPAAQMESVGRLFAHDNQGSSSPAMPASVTNASAAYPMENAAANLPDVASMSLSFQNEPQEAIDPVQPLQEGEGDVAASNE